MTRRIKTGGQWRAGVVVLLLAPAVAAWGQVGKWQPRSGAYSGPVSAEVAAPGAAPADSSTRGGQNTGARGADNCLYSVSRTSGPTVPSTGGAYRLRIITSRPACTWVLEAAPNWLPVQLGWPANGTGTGDIQFNAPRHPGGEARSGVVQIAGLREIVVQMPVPAAAVASAISSLDANSQPLCSARFTDGRSALQERRIDGSRQAIALQMSGQQTNGSSCEWKIPAAITPLSSFLAVGSYDRTTAQVEVVAEENLMPEPRRGTLQVNYSTGRLTSGQVGWTTEFLTVIQNQGEPCELAADDFTLVAPAAGEERTWVTRKLKGNCQITPASADQSWVRILDTAEFGVRYRVEPNATTLTRNAKLTVPNLPRELNVSQFGQQCSITLDPRDLRLGPEEGTKTVIVGASLPGCPWSVGFGERGNGSSASTPPPAWIEVLSPRTGSGTGEFRFRYQRNESAASRAATVAIGGQTLSIAQDGINCEYRVSPTVRTLPTAGGTVEVQVETAAGCPWTASSDAAWLPITAGSVNRGPGAALASAGSLGAAESRQGRIFIYGPAKLEQTVVVTQTGVVCTYQVDTTAFNLPASGGTAAVNVSTPAPCAWTVVNIPAWASGVVPGPRSGPQALAFNISSNTQAQQRTAVISVAGVAVTITQAGARGVKFVGDPAVITQCTDGLGRLTISWEAPDAATPVRVHVNSPTGPQPSGGDASGSFETGDWVVDGTVFYLVDANGQVLATYTATVRCGGGGSSGGGGNTGTSALSLSPNPLLACPAPKDPVAVDWNLSGAGPFKIMYKKPTDLRAVELLRTSDARGKTTTSAALEDNTLFYVLDGADQELSRAYLRIDSACGTRLSAAAVTLAAAATANPCIQPPARASYVITDWNAYLWFDLDGLPANATARVEFRNPNGRLDQFTDLRPLGAARYCSSARLAIFSAPLEGDARPAAYTPGNWEARVVVNNMPVGSRELRIEGPVRVGNAYMRSDVPDSPYEGNPRTDFPLSIRYAALYFTLQGMKGGDIVRAFFFRDGEYLSDLTLQWDAPPGDMDTWFVAWSPTQALLAPGAAASFWQVVVTLERQGVMYSLFPVQFRVRAN